MSKSVMPAHKKYYYTIFFLSQEMYLFDYKLYFGESEIILTQELKAIFDEVFNIGIENISSTKEDLLKIYVASYDKFQGCAHFLRDLNAKQYNSFQIKLFRLHKETLKKIILENE